MKNNDTITFIGYTIAGILLFGITFLLYKTGNEWIAKRLCLSGFTIFSWYNWYMGCKEGRIRPFTKKDRPFGFLCIKYTNLIINILITIGVCYYWIFV